MPAAQYIRMSTEHQQYSTENQADAIRDYATKRGYEIVRTYADAGKSGLKIEGREALQRLIADVESGRADFKTILVYDISRWGRFQTGRRYGPGATSATRPRSTTCPSGSAATACTAG